MLLVGLDAVEDGRLDIGYDKSVEIIENSALDNFKAYAPLLLGWQIFRVLLPEQEGHDHLMRLLVEFEELGVAQLVVPAPHVRSGKNELKKAFSYAAHAEISLA